MAEIICAVIAKDENSETYKVQNLVVFDAPGAISAVKAAMGYEYLIPVDERVALGDIYDPERDIFTRNGERIYPDISESERIAALEEAQNDTDAALMELAQMIGGV